MPQMFPMYWGFFFIIFSVSHLTAFYLITQAYMPSKIPTHLPKCPLLDNWL